MKILKGRVVYPGNVKGEAIVTSEPIGLYGGLDPNTGIITQQGHPLYGQCITGKIFVFPYGVGSTVGSYILYRAKKMNRAPLAIINKDAELIVVVGGIISEIPMVYKIPIEEIKSGDTVEIKDNGDVVVY